MAWATIAINVGVSAISAGVRYLMGAGEGSGYDPLNQRRLPQMSASDPIPVVFGTVRLTAPNVHYSGGPASKPFGETGGDERQARYQAHLIWCHGPIDEAGSILYGGENFGAIGARDDAAVWDDTLAFSQYGYSGAEDTRKGRTIRGRFYFGLMPEGSGVLGVDRPDRPISDEMVSYNHVASMYCEIYTGQDSLKPVALVVVRKEARSFDEPAWYPAKIPSFPNPGQNPVHIIHECLTDKLWGLGLDVAKIDDASFKAAADTLYDEELFLSGVLTAETRLADFIEQILNHIDGTFYVEPTTGKMTINLVRDDYTVGNLAQLTDSNCSATYTRPHTDDLPTRISAVYRAADGSEVSFPQTNQAAFAVRGEATKEMRYPMVVEDSSSSTFARSIIARLAARDLRQLTNPLATVEIRDAHWSAAKDLRPGDAFIWSSQEHGVVQMICRVTEIDFGEADSSGVKIDAVEDAFAYDDGIFADPGDSEWVDPINDPSAAEPRLALELPIWLTLDVASELQGGVTTSDYETETRGALGLAAGRPTPDAIDLDLYVNGGLAEDAHPFCPVLTLEGSIPQEYTSTGVSISGDLDELAESTDYLVAIAIELAAGGTYIEMAIATSIDLDAETLTLERGWGDTVPPPEKPPAGTDLFVLGRLYDDAGTPRLSRRLAADRTLRADGTNCDLQATTRTPLGQLALADAPADTVTLSERMIRPYPPGNFQITDNSAADLTGHVQLDWAERNRLDEPLTQGDATSQTPETGTTYYLDIYGEDNTGSESLLHAESGVTVTTFTYENEQEAADNGKGSLSSWLRFELIAERDGYFSWQYHDWRMDR